jgi:hypothetical protein
MINKSIYKTNQYTQTVGGTNLTLSASNTTTSEFRIPNEAINLSRGYIMFDALLPAIAATRANIVFSDSLPIQSLELNPLAGDKIVQIQNTQIYSKFCQAASIDMKEYLSRTGVYGAAAIGTGRPITEINGCQPYGATLFNTSANNELQTVSPSASYIVSNTATNSNGAASTDVRGTTNDEKTPQRLVISIDTNGANTLGVRFKIPLSAFSGTVLAVDKTICFGQIIRLVVNWVPYLRFGFASSKDLANQNDLAASPAITNLYLYVPSDISDYGDMVYETVNNGVGIEMIIPYVECANPSDRISADRMVSYQYPITKNTGGRLKRIMLAVARETAAYASVETAQLNNVNQVRFSTIKTFIHGKQLQNYPLSVNDSTLWSYMKPLIGGSPAGLDQRNYMINCFFLDNFADCEPSYKWNELDSHDHGLTVDADTNYIAQINATADNRVYCFAVWTKKLLIRPNGVRWM